ncbi:hypothetical protein [Oerskovia gallyi]|uniref:Uncharacterized protein n=1 Tax=Oerskovia gallyi TaxID=2762226 RepID=A0ABR8V5C4_9CELL|nr:hypothetical protein [Oerskovia gallyi]MBD7999985.1 hypothetical protein [Oerskovia gallyi]
MRIVDPRAGSRPLGGAAAASLLLGGLLLGTGPAAASAGSLTGDRDPQGVGLQVDVSGVTSQSQVEADAQGAVPGGALGVRGSGLVPLTPYDVHLHSAYAAPVRLATAISLADGTFGLSALLPGSVQPGTHFVRVTDPGTGGYLDTAPFEIGAPAEPGGSAGGAEPGTGAGPVVGGADDGGLAATGPLDAEPVAVGKVHLEADDAAGLAFTGAAVVGALAAAGALVVAGVVALTGARRRRRARTT